MKIKIERYIETLAGKPINGYRFYLMNHNYCGNLPRYEGQEWKQIRDADEFQKIEIPVGVFSTYKKKLLVNESIILERVSGGYTTWDI